MSDRDPRWFEDYDKVVSTAEQAIEDGALTSANDVLAFFEKPWNYGELHTAWEQA
jgi:hypothetical protein